MKLFAAIVAFLCFFTPAWAAPHFPALTGRVVDGANILSAATKEDLDQKLAALEAKTSRQLVVVTLASLEGYEISDYGYQLGRAWGIGQKTLNNGALLIVAPNEHRVRVEVGYGLEPILTDAFSEVIIQNQILPAFRKGDFNGGVEAGVDALVQQLSLETSAAEAKAAAAAQQSQQGDNGQSGGIAGFLIFLFIIFAVFRIFGGWGLLPLLFMGGGGGYRGGGGFGGGGFGGGGGSFGGGGASGELVMLSHADHEAISGAIEAAEQKTDGEIFCVLAHEVSNYREIPLLWAALAAFFLPPLMVLLGLHRLAMADIFSSWTDESVRSVEHLIVRALSTYAVAQAALFLAVAVVVALPSVRRALTPRFLKRHRVRQVARHHFTASGLRLSDAEPHILIFASLADRQVELVAHDAIHRAVGEGPWNAAVAAVAEGMKNGRPAEGFVRAIEICGAALAEHFPPQGAPKN